MENTKGELIAEPKLSDLENLNPKFSIGIKGGKILFHSTLENALANTYELLRRWNNHDDLLAAADEGLHECERVKMHCHCSDKDLGGLLKRIERIEQTIAKAKKS